jgi:hypothetical protein
MWDSAGCGEEGRDDEEAEVDDEETGLGADLECDVLAGEVALGSHLDLRREEWSEPARGLLRSVFEDASCVRARSCLKLEVT